MRNNSFRAISTRYKGYNFRSRLEARWAVFFDHLGIRWDYEPEGFELGNGLRYLPDFWLPDWKVWVEIKPSACDDAAREKAYRLVRQSGHALYMTNGLPDWAGTLFFSYTQTGGEVCLWDFPASIMWDSESIKKEPFFWVYYDHMPEGWVECDEKVTVWCSPFSAERAAEPVDCPVAALNAARSARFEFGQEGA